MEESQTTPSPEFRALESLGLLSFLHASLTSDEYVEAAARAPGRVHPTWRIVVIAAITVVALVAGIQTARNASADARQRDAIIQQINQHKSDLSALTAQVNSAQAEITQLEGGVSSVEHAASSAKARLELWAIQAGTTAVTGPGVQITMNNAPASEGSKGVIQDRDLQQVVDGLWQSGAEAISINGQRVTALTAIRTAGSAITVNYDSLTPPYVIDAIGNSAAMPAAFSQSTGGSAWLDLQQQLGMVFSMTAMSSLTLPGVALPDLRSAHVAQGGAAQ